MQNNNQSPLQQITQVNNNQQLSLNNPQVLKKHKRDEQYVQNDLFPLKKSKNEEIEIKKYANIIQSTFPNPNNFISTKPLQYNNLNNINRITIIN